MPRQPIDPADYREVRIDISTLTLGEAAEAERQSNMTIQQLVRGRATLKLLAMFMHELRHSDEPRSWQELSSLRLLDVSPSTSGASSEAASPTSSD